MPFGFSGKRVVGPAFTLRFVRREDLGNPRKLVEADLHPHGNRSHAGRLRRRTPTPWA